MIRFSLARTHTPSHSTFVSYLITRKDEMKYFFWGISFTEQAIQMGRMTAL